VTGRPVSVSRWDDIKGLKFGGIQGHRYAKLQPLIEAGLLHREDAMDQQGSLGKLCLGWVDFVVMSRSEYEHASLPKVCTVALTAWSMPDPDRFERRVLVVGPDDISAALLKAVGRAACQSSWLAALKAARVEAPRSTPETPASRPSAPEIAH
jgi:hypothetical protein